MSVTTDPVVYTYYYRPPFSLAVAVTTNSSWHSTSFRQPSFETSEYRLRRLWRLDEVSRHVDRLCPLRCTASAAVSGPPVRSQSRSPLAGDVSCLDAAGLRKRIPHRQSAAISAQATSVDYKLCCSTGVLIVAVRPHHSTPISAKWAL